MITNISLVDIHTGEVIMRDANPTNIMDWLSEHKLFCIKQTNSDDGTWFIYVGYIHPELMNLV